MPRSIVSFDFSDVAPALADFQRQTIAKVDEVGKDAVEYAVKNGNYKDRSGRLRRSNKYKADESGLELTNDAEYASQIEAKEGCDVLSGAALYAESKLKEIFEK